MGPHGQYGGNMPVQSWSKGGIHPNAKGAKNGYKKSIRNAIVKALEKMRKAPLSTEILL